MSYSDPPILNALTETQNITQRVYSEKLKAEQPWVNKISKYLMQNQTVFEIPYLSYTKWRPPGADPVQWPPIVNQGCGKLTYTIVHKSWETAWLGNDILFRQLDDISYYGVNGTINYVVAQFRE